MSGADPNEHAKYCQLCDRPNYSEYDICVQCSLALDREDDDDVDPDDWAGMTRYERTQFVILNLENGNYTDAVNFIMHDGDVRADSVKLALDVALGMLDSHSPETATARIDALNRAINMWETR